MAANLAESVPPAKIKPCSRVPYVFPLGMGYQKLRWLSDLDPKSYLHLTCEGCRHKRVLAVSDVSAFLAARGKSMVHWLHLPRHFVCERCGRRSPFIEPSMSARR